MSGSKSDKTEWEDATLTKFKEAYPGVDVTSFSQIVELATMSKIVSSWLSTERIKYSQKGMITNMFGNVEFSIKQWEDIEAARVVLSKINVDYSVATKEASRVHNDKIKTLWDEREKKLRTLSPIARVMMITTENLDVTDQNYLSKLKVTGTTETEKETLKRETLERIKKRKLLLAQKHKEGFQLLEADFYPSNFVWDNPNSAKE